MEAVAVNGYTIEPGANPKGAKADRDTFWRDDFDPVATGVEFLNNVEVAALIESNS